MIKPALSRGKIKVIGATTTPEYRKYIEKDSALERRFQPIFVQEPNREDSIAILRGIKERYEQYHGIAISDQAIVDSVDFSIKYLPDRRLPDKAIDCIDEAAAAVRTTLASKPAELERAEKELRTLEIEKAALTREKDTPKERLTELEGRIILLRTSLEEKRSNWESEKKRLEQKESLKNRIEQKRQEAIQGERMSDFNLVAKIRYSEIPALEKELQNLEDTLLEARKNGTLSLHETVDSTDIARVISKWTGIPVGQLGTTEKERVRRLPENMKLRVIGQDEALDAISAAIARSKTGISEPDRPIGSFLLL